MRTKNVVALLTCAACGWTEPADADVDLNRAPCSACDQPTALVAEDDDGIRVELAPGGEGMFWPHGDPDEEETDTFGAANDNFSRIYEEAGEYLVAFLRAEA
jgi:hypothetical protein